MKKSIWISRLWLVFFLILPFLYVVILSFITKGIYGGILWQGTLKNYDRALQAQSQVIFLQTFFIAALNGLFCVVLAFGVGTFIQSRKPHQRFLWLALFVLPFFINSLIRLYSLQTFVGTQGFLQSSIRFFVSDFIEMGLSHNRVMLFLGLVLIYLPFALLPVNAAFEKWDMSLTEAAEDLGAGRWQIFWQIVWPSFKPSVLSAYFMVFIPTFGEYLVPEFLEGSQKMYWGQYIVEAYLKWRHWPLGAALGCLLIVFLLLVLRFERNWHAKP